MAGAAKQAITAATGPSFDEVLRGTKNSATDSATTLKELIQGIQQRLASVGIDLSTRMNQSLQMSVTANGIQIDGHHERAAEMEAQINADPQLLELAKKLREHGGPTQFTLSDSA
jgi:cob(I)alamin adenosyltransferase